MMLHHLSEHAAADCIEKALLATFASGVRTFDLGGKVGTEEFTRKLCDAIGRA